MGKQRKTISERERPSGADELAMPSHLRLEADRRLSMSERLARVHALSKQVGTLAGAARRK